MVLLVPLSHGDPRSEGRMEPGNTRAVQMRARWPREGAAVATAGSQGGSLGRGPGPCIYWMTHQQGESCL